VPATTAPDEGADPGVAAHPPALTEIAAMTTTRIAVRKVHPLPAPLATA